MSSPSVDQATRHGLARAASSIRTLLDQTWFWAILFFVLILIIQIGSLGKEVIDRDEATFILIASDVLKGNLPYVELFDNKPPFLFFVLASAMWLFGEELHVVRLFGDACIFISCLAAFSIARNFCSTVSAGLAGLLIISVHSPIFAQYTSSELPATAMFMASLYLIVRHGNSFWAIVIAGILVSLATMTRTNLALVAIALSLYLLAGQFFAAPERKTWVVIPFCVAGLVPPLIVALVYWNAGSFHELRLATIDVPLSYSSSQRSFGGFIDMTALHAKSWYNSILWSRAIYAPFTALSLFGLALSLIMLLNFSDKSRDQKRSNLAIFAVTAAVFLSIILTSNIPTPHYRLQLLPLFGIYCAIALNWLGKFAILREARFALVAVSLLAAVAHTAPSAYRILSDPRELRSQWLVLDAAEAVAAARQPGDQVWALDAHLVLWYLDEPLVSKVSAFPNTLATPSILSPLIAGGYIPPGELNRVIESRPSFIVTEGHAVPRYIPESSGLAEIVSSEYEIFFANDALVVFRRVQPQ